MSSYNAVRGLRSKNRRIVAKCQKRLGCDRCQFGTRASVHFTDAIHYGLAMGEGFASAARHATAALAGFADAVSAAAARGADWFVVADQIKALREPLAVIDYRPAGETKAGANDEQSQ